MEVKVKNAEATPTKFPCLMEHRKYSIIVIRISETQGTVLHPGTAGYNIGHIQSFFFGEHWTLFDGVIEMKN